MAEYCTHANPDDSKYRIIYEYPTSGAAELIGEPITLTVTRQRSPGLGVPHDLSQAVQKILADAQHGPVVDRIVTIGLSTLQR